MKETLTFMGWLAVAAAIQIGGTYAAVRLGCGDAPGPCTCTPSTPSYSPWAADKIEVTCTNVRTMDVRYHELTREEWQAFSGQAPAARQ